MERKTNLTTIAEAKEHRGLLKQCVSEFLQEMGDIDSFDRKGVILYLVEVFRFTLVQIKDNAPSNLGLGVCHQIGVMQWIAFSKDPERQFNYQSCLEYLVEGLLARTFKLNESEYGTPVYPILDKTSALEGPAMQFMNFDLSYGNQAALRIEYLGHLLSELDNIENEIHKETYPIKDSVLWNKINNDNL